MKAIALSSLLLGMTITVVSSVAITAPTKSTLVEQSQTSMMHDPTQPIVAEGAAYFGAEEEIDNIFGIRISSTIVAKDRKIATINGQLLQAGDRIGDLILLDIYPGAVQIKDKTGVFVVKMPYSDIKTLVEKPTSNAAVAANRNNKLLQAYTNSNATKTISRNN